VYVEALCDWLWSEQRRLKYSTIYSSLSVGLIDGDFGSLFWVFVGPVFWYNSIVASLAEMESM
jgi:hypothetical protein